MTAEGSLWKLQMYEAIYMSANKINIILNEIGHPWQTICYNLCCDCKVPIYFSGESKCCVSQTN